ncbi:MAG: Glycosyl transferase, group 2 family [Candidatus Pacebacteria bacterium GW2011_GWB1_47_8]|nr:MAG: Glycosyl transferase, group 2 family [Candidatus Pacebacteria bacterium GW2011_GWA1_46_10]KKU84381.1 MAG: Glycosyl transferase, group 2 family [Candidatus Pacebacteria bacterium GW2011_GWB1_47_8]
MISVVLATYNEAANLARCLVSVDSFADEIIVVDGSSTDDTRRIAKKFGAKVIKTTNKLNFHINKQMAMDRAKGELVLQIDADEVVDEELARFIRSVEKQRRKSSLATAAWWIRRKNLFLGRWLTKGGQYPDPVIRLYINGRAKLPQADVHEQMAVDGPLGWANGHLQHYANPTFTDYVRKFNTYTSFRAQLWAKEGWRLSLWRSVYYLLWKPIEIFLSLYVRHKGFSDGYPGFVFALMSGLHYPVAYLKWWEIKQGKRRESTY